MSRAVFLDRDGTLIHDAGYLSDPAGVVVLPGAVEGLRRLRDAGFLLFLLTNQSGVGRGLYTLEDVHRVNARMLEMLGLGADLFRGVGIAPEAPDQPPVYRKPSPRYILEQAALHGLDLARSWMVGDRPGDWEAGLAAGARPAAVMTSPLAGAAAVDPRWASLPRFPDLAAFAREAAP